MTGAHPSLAAPDDDPRLWLEEIEGAQALAWVAEQNAKTRARLMDAGYEADKEALRAILDRPDNIPHIIRRGGLLYNFWTDADHKRGLWRRTTEASYATATPEWDVLLDLDALAASENEDWIWHGADTRLPHHDRAILRLSRGGGDAVVLREFDLGTRRFAADGFHLPEAKAGTDWLDDDTLLLAAAIGENGATDAGYARQVRLWRRGTDPLAAPVLFEVAKDAMSAWGGYDRDSGHLIFAAQLGFYDTDIWIGDRSGPQRKVERPTDSGILWHKDWLALRPRTPWTIGGTTYAPDTVLGTSLSAYLAGDHRVTVLFEPGQRRALQGFFWVGDRLVIRVLDTLAPEHLVADPAQNWAVHPLQGLPGLARIDVWGLDAVPDESNGDVLAMVQTPLTPPTLMRANLGTQAAPAVLKQAPIAFDPGQAVVTRHEAVSSDGERIPYLQVGPAGLTGDAPVYMTGYGGFRIPMLPSYAVRAGKLWIERGGTYVQAAIRGGGEFGTWWHDAGRREGKIRSHDDFAAIAADLVTRGVTRPERIAAEGGSNGGLLIANMLTRYPERFGALFCTIPLIDMRRYHRLLAGASWMAEYGDPEKPEDWAFMQNFSAYQAAEPGRRYPPILIGTTRRDDRVHPGHARKFAAKLQDMGYDALFYEPEAGGHGFGRDNSETASFAALGMKFLREAIGWK